MPARAPSICSHCQRPHRLDDACETVKRMHRERKARFDKTRPNSSRRGYDRQWEDEAKAFLALPENRRCACGAPATVVMHIQSIRKRPDLRMVKANWKPGCKRCNAIDAVAERQAHRS